jgi:AraC-like DNA-binding protein
MASQPARNDAELSIRRHDSGLGRWELARRAPHPRLAPYVRELQGYIEYAPQRIRRREMPSESVALILNLGPPFRMIDPRDGSAMAERGTFVAGLHESHAIVDSEGAAYCLQADLTPIGAYRFFAVPMRHLAGVTTEVGDIQGRASERLLERLYEAPDWSARFDLLEDFMARRIGAARGPTRGVVWAWQRLERSHGLCGIRALADELGWSRVHLARQFREQIGLPPKTVAQVLRFSRTLELLPACGRGGLAELALACGYADQAHMNRDFRRFSGWSPTEYLRHQVPGGGGSIES